MPSTRPPSIKVTAPVGATVPVLGVTVAVKITLVPAVTLVALAPSLVEVPMSDDVPVAVPTRGISCVAVPGVLSELSVTASAAVRAPEVVGAKVTPIVHVACRASGVEVEQVVDPLLTLKLVLVVAMLLNVKGPLPLFLIVVRSAHRRWCPSIPPQ